MHGETAKLSVHMRPTLIQHKFSTSHDSQRGGRTPRECQQTAAPVSAQAWGCASLGMGFGCSVAAVTESPLNYQTSTALLYPEFTGEQLTKPWQLRGLGERHLGQHETRRRHKNCLQRSLTVQAAGGATQSNRGGFGFE